LTEKAKTADDKTESPPDRLEAGRENLRQTLKWMIAGFGAVGAALALGTQFSKLGETTGGEKALAVLAGMVAFGGVVVALWLSAKVLTGSHMTLGRLAAESRAAKEDGTKSFLVRFFEDDNRHILGPYASLYEIYDKYVAAQRASDEPTVLTLSGYVKQIGNVASYEELRHNFEKGLTWIIAALGATALGILIFAASVGGGTTEDEGATAAPLKPVTVDVSLTGPGKEMLADELGPDCVKGNVAAMAIGQSGTNLEVVSLPTSECNVVRFEVTQEIGTATPSRPACEVSPDPPSARGPPECGVFP
jgi:hypothetical protein